MMNNKYVIGVDLGGTKIYTALVDLEGEIQKEIIISTEADKGQEHVKKNINKTIDYILEGISKEDIKAIGIGSPGPLDLEQGMIITNSNLPFKNFKIVESIKNRYEIDTYLDNDANAATLAEYMFGAGKGSKNMVYVTASTGIGAGAVLNGSILRGSTGNALELGHMTVCKEGPRCGCGNIGCAEALGSGTAITKRAREAVASNAETSLKNYTEVTSKEVFIEAKKGDRVCKEILNSALSYLGIAVANIANIIDPEVIVVGGGVTNGGSIVLDKIEEEVKVRSLKTIANNVKIYKAQLGGKAGVLGAAALAIIESNKK